MKLEEQFQKETGISDTLENYSELYKYESTYSKWLEEKLTWKKFSEQPKIDRDVLIRRSIDKVIILNTKISNSILNHYLLYSEESEWMYVPN